MLALKMAPCQIMQVLVLKRAKESPKLSASVRMRMFMLRLH